jgi:hypothetical protein
VIEDGDASEDDMVAAFLRAEVDSSRFSHMVIHLLATLGWTRALIDSPNLADPTQNSARKTILSNYRGYPDRALFTGFPNSVQWRRVQLDPQEVAALRYARDSTLVTLSGGTLRLPDGARNYNANPSDPAHAHIGEILKALRAGTTFAPLIAVGTATDAPIVIEGNSRTTAYVIEHWPNRVKALVGSAPSLQGWAFY